MDVILETAIDGFWISFIEIVIENATEEEKQIYSKFDFLEFRIHSNFWKADILEALRDHCFETHPLTPINLSNWLLRYAHALCEHSLLDRPTLKLVHELDTFRPRESFISKLISIEKIDPDLYRQYLNNPHLDAENLHSNLSVLLEMEDIEDLREYLPLTQLKVDLDFRKDLRFKVELNQKTIAKIKDTVSLNLDEVVIIQNSRRGDYELSEMLIPDIFKNVALKLVPLPFGAVKMYGWKHIHCQLSDFSTSVKNSKQCDLVFRPTRIAIRYQQNALMHLRLKINADVRTYLFPERNKKPTSQLTNDVLTLELVNAGLAKNPEQLEAVTNIVRGPNAYAPYIIFGPPGTGKTTTIVEAIIQLRLQKPESRILVAAGSNDACDTIAIRLCEIFNNNASIQKHLENETMFPMLRIYSRSILSRGTQNIPEELCRRSNLQWTHGKIADPSFEYIHRYGIVLATLCTVGKLVRGNVGKNDQYGDEVADLSDTEVLEKKSNNSTHFSFNDAAGLTQPEVLEKQQDKPPSNHFTHVFIDEAAASSEPEALIGIMGIKNGVHDESCRVILSGDHKQLGAVIKSAEAKKLGLDKSLMERLLEREIYAVDDNGDYDRTLQMRLRRNYRSHPEIVRLYNHLYYNDELIAMNPATENENKPPVKWAFLPNPEFPIAFQVVHGFMRKDGTLSSCNMLEVKVLCTYVCRLLRLDEVNQTDIGVITPYKLQGERIRERFRERNWLKIEVGSVENFQGREKPIIIASMVRSNNCLGFVRCPRRLNVLLSRPKSLLIILGEPHTLSGSEDLKFIINECKINGNYLEKIKIEPESNNKTTPTNSSKKKKKNKGKTAKNSANEEKHGQFSLLNDDVDVNGVSPKTQKSKLLKGKKKQGFLALQKTGKKKIIKIKKDEKAAKNMEPPKRRSSF